MTFSVSIVSATYGAPAWPRLAEMRAIPSAERQGGYPIVAVHADNLMNARNQALERVETEYVIYLDADDELSPGYVDAMAAGTADLRAPMVTYIARGVPAPARFPKVGGHWHECTGDCLPDGNWLIIGTCARTELLREVGGFRDWAWSEDWDLWYRCHLAGGTIEGIPDALYRAYVRPDSRNRGQSEQHVKDACFRGIQQACREWARERKQKEVVGAPGRA
jgi:glycosyltransferase involved in cell wall biosynthesis